MMSDREHFRTNLAVTLANSQISSTAKYGKVFPHMNDDGAYPTDFSTPKTVETMRVLDSTCSMLPLPSSCHLNLSSIFAFSFFFPSPSQPPPPPPSRPPPPPPPSRPPPPPPSALTSSLPRAHRLPTRPHHANLSAPARPPLRSPEFVLIPAQQPVAGRAHQQLARPSGQAAFPMGISRLLETSRA